MNMIGSGAEVDCKVRCVVSIGLVLWQLLTIGYQ